eukprot:GHUV01040607.1.p1 GENE.GHUV01040607.1~~GHUV01040607.1.p1  ORF type:complete len:100 (-),score=10.12 GHUV01040607.1:358-657(-)
MHVAPLASQRTQRGSTGSCCRLPDWGHISCSAHPAGLHPQLLMARLRSNVVAAILTLVALVTPKTATQSPLSCKHVQHVDKSFCVAACPQVLPSPSLIT